jgi:predicted ArsR family transcriptional regulator
VAVAALEDGLRRGMYQFIRRAGRPVTRDEAAAEVGISRKLAAFHLDKLVAAGLLEAAKRETRELRRVGRHPKAYRPADVDIRITIPERQPLLLAEMLLDAAVTAMSDETMREAALRIARERGRELGARERRTARGRWGSERVVATAQAVLERQGFEPAQDGSCVRLRNCPFHPLAARAPDFVCAMNHHFVSGVLQGLRAATVTAILSPTAGECCVRLEPGTPKYQAITR